MKPMVIAGPSANCGKTTLACRIIEAAPGIQALKITRFHRESRCPVHGADDDGHDRCDGCDEPPEGFEIVAAASRLLREGKDTWRMARAGADPVLWLRAAPHTFTYAIHAALKKFSAARPLLIEGNSAATLPDIEQTTVILWPRRPRGVKASVLPALKRADFLLIEEAEDGSRRLPGSLKAACTRSAASLARLPEPVWLPFSWWREESATKEPAERLAAALTG